MSRGTTLTLFKKYNIKMNDAEFKSIVEKYVSYHKNNDYSEKKKKDSEYAKDIPIVTLIDPFRESSKYDEATKKWIDVRPKQNFDNVRNNLLNYVDTRDRMYCEKMMEWNFGSTFDCLVEKYNLGHYNYADDMMEITQTVASKMLSAINYILGGEWSDNIERGMNNEFIKVFTEGYNCDSYWKYVNRNRKCGKDKIFKIKQDGYDITIKCPNQGKKNTDCDFASEIEESDSTIEYCLENLRYGLTAFLKSDNWNRDCDENGVDDKWFKDLNNFEYKYMLTYEYWG